MSDLSFWGPVTSTIDWCEPNYKVLSFIAEPANTLSNLSFVVLGLIGAMHEINQVSMQRSRMSYVLLFAGVAMIGLGSMLFHGTLRIWGQQLDELPMVWYLLVCMYIVNNDFPHNFLGASSTSPTTTTKDKITTNISISPINTTRKSIQQSVTFNSSKSITSPSNMWKIALPLYGIVFTATHLVLKTTTAFQVHFGALLGIVLLRIYQKYKQQYQILSSDQRFIIFLYLASGLFGFIFWLIDYHHCSFFHSKSIYPCGHVLWHLFMGYSAYCSVLMIKVLDMIKNGQELRVMYKCGFIPFTYGLSTGHHSKADYLSKDIEMF